MNYIKNLLNEYLKYIVYVLVYTGIYSIITSIWIIAEREIEGVNTTSIVDTFVAIILTGIISYKLNKYIEVSKIA